MKNNKIMKKITMLDAIAQIQENPKIDIWLRDAEWKIYI